MLCSDRCVTSAPVPGSHHFTNVNPLETIVKTIQSFHKFSKNKALHEMDKGPFKCYVTQVGVGGGINFSGKKR